MNKEKLEQLSKELFGQYVSISHKSGKSCEETIGFFYGVRNGDISMGNRKRGPHSSPSLEEDAYYWSISAKNFEDYMTLTKKEQ